MLYSIKHKEYLPDHDNIHVENMNLSQARMYLSMGLDELYLHNPKSNKHNHSSQHFADGNFNYIQEKSESYNINHVDLDISGTDEAIHSSFEVLEESAFILLAFISLELSDPYSALIFTRQLLGGVSQRNRFLLLPIFNKIVYNLNLILISFYLYRHLVETYHIEALCLSKNLTEAKQYVEMEHSIESLKSSFHNIFLPELISNEILQSESVYVMTKINRAVKLLTFGNVDESWLILQQIFQSLPKASKIIQTVLYILILSGQSEKANELILNIR